MSDRKKITERLGRIGTCADIVSGDDMAVSEVPLADLHEFILTRLFFPTDIVAQSV